MTRPRRTAAVLLAATCVLSLGALSQAGAQAATAYSWSGGSLLNPLQLFTSAGSLDPVGDPASLYSLTRSVGARALWSRGITGRGVGVALIDSGVAKVAGLSVTDGPDLSATSGTVIQSRDGFGHGTAMAGIIAGRDAGPVAGLLAPASSKYDGIAPDASLINIKVAEASGWSDPSRVIPAIAWAVQHHNDAGHPIQVINLSYGTDSNQPYGSDPIAYAVEQAWKAGIVVVVSGGNNGSGSPAHLLNPAIDPYVIAVGAGSSGSDVNATVPSFSSLGNGVRNPDVLAPGVSIQSLRAPGSVIDKLVPATAADSSRFVRGTGTSEAAAVVTGMVALLLQAHPGLTPDQVKASLTASAHSLPSTSTKAQGHGLVDVNLASKTTTTLNVTQTWTPSRGNGSLDASRGSDSWTSAGATVAQAENPALMGGPTGANWGGVAWAGRFWAGSSWAAVAANNSLDGRSWSGRSWS